MSVSNLAIGALKTPATGKLREKGQTGYRIQSAVKHCGSGFNRESLESGFEWKPVRLQDLNKEDLSESYRF